MCLQLLYRIVPLLDHRETLVDIVDVKEDIKSYLTRVTLVSIFFLLSLLMLRMSFDVPSFM